MDTRQIEELRPTQMTHGAREVREKARQYRSLSAHDLQMAIAEKPIPVVCGPKGIPFAIDHHHVAAALWQVGVRSVPVVLVRDLSSYTWASFWLSMENERWTFPYDEQGVRRPFAEFARHVWEMKDDEYRSLAAAVRDAGGYEKTNVPLEEFRWSDFFRAMLPRPDNDEKFSALLKEALKLAKSDLALGLPGYLGRTD
ncbi:ParB-like protein [Paraburkholderia youngii]|uniref:ParB-like protein n=1 Tax=Paraburkholderia youngii TaxID=2782701 RepID=UPI003D22338A